MRRLRAWAHRLLGALARDRREQDLADEIASNLQLHIDDNLKAGLSHEEARRQAHLKFGGVEGVKEAYRDRCSFRALETLGQDIIFAARQVRRSPTAATAAMLSLALAIGANTAVFSVLNTSLRGVPFRDADRLVMIHVTSAENAEPSPGVSVPEYLALRDETRVFTSVGALISWPYNLGSEQHGMPAERLGGWRYTDTLFQALGLQPQLGRAFTADENAMDAPPGSAIISHTLWQGRFGGDPDIIGRVLLIDDVPTTVVGVMPADFRFFDGRPAPDIWTPLPFLAAQVESASRGPVARFVRVIAKLEPGVSVEQAQADLSRLAADLARRYPLAYPGTGFWAQPLDDAYFGAARPILLILQATVALVLLIACTNVAGLLLVRAASRQREIATRHALGADRVRIARQFLTESLLVSLGGGLAGLALAWVLIRFVNESPLEVLAHFPRVQLDPGVLLFTAVVSVLTGLLFGTVPAVHGTRGNLFSAIRQSGRTGGLATRRLQRTLVAGQLAVTLVLLVGAGLLVRSFIRLQAADLGADPRGVLTFDTRLPNDQYQKPAGNYRNSRILASSPVPAQIFDRIHQGLLTIPGVEAAGGMNWPPLSGAVTEVPLAIEGRTTMDGRPGDPRDAATAVYYMATPGIFQALRIPVRRGRDFTAADTATRPWVAVINEAMARRYWPTEEPLGQRVTALLTPDEQPREIVGVVGDLAITRRDRLPTPTIWVLRAQQPGHHLPIYGQRTQITYALRFRGTLDSIVPAVRRAVAVAEPTAPIANLELLDTALGRQVETPRFYMMFMAGFAVLATVLAVVGLYGLVSYAVTERTREIAVRMALGAGVGRVVRLVLREGAVLLVVGLTIGLVGALAATRYLRTILWEVEPTDPLTFAGVVALLAAVAVAANLVPTARVLRVDPKAVLGSE
jgi:putative ABC transport system permease protein